MRTAWTGGQYSLVRFFLAATLAWNLVVSGAWGVVATPIALALGLGFVDRAAAMVLAFLLAATDVGHGTLDGASRWMLAAWLLTHTTLPNAPYGSLAARGRIDADGAWTMPTWYPAAAAALFVAMRLAFGVRASFEGELPVAGVLTTLGLLASSPRLLPVAWTLSLGLEIGRVIAGGDATPGAWILHLLTFQPAWMPPREQRAPAFVFYDGSCALCHGAVRFLLAEDPPPARFRIAALGGASFASHLGAERGATLPDSVVVLKDDGEVLVRSDATVEILDAIGGWWRVVSHLIALVPRSLRDFVYDFVAARRYRWFGSKDASCPLTPPAQRARFDD